MGADYYEEIRPARAGEPPLGIGENCIVDHAIIDKNARIGNGVVITPEGKPENADGPAEPWPDGVARPRWYIRDGIVIVPKGAVIPEGSWI
jgi:glucose-1-phosphate adenylyltransferase